MNPYDNNPFATDKKEISNEHDANRALVDSVKQRIELLNHKEQKLQGNEAWYYMGSRHELESLVIQIDAGFFK